MGLHPTAVLNKCVETPKTLVLCLYEKRHLTLRIFHGKYASYRVARFVSTEETKPRNTLKLGSGHEEHLPHRPRMTCSTPEMPSSNFLFIEVQQTGKVPPRRDIRTAIQKHVMRDIGVARRGQPRPQRQLENVRDCKKHEASLFRNIVPKTHPEKYPIRKVHTKAITSAQELAYTGPSAKVPWLVSGGCRTDPFACFPIHMTSETSFLIDYCEYTGSPFIYI